MDTSAILAVITQQPEAPELVRLTRGAALIAPSSIHWEVGNALSAMFKRKAITLESALQLLSAYAAIPIRRFDVSLSRSINMASQLNIYAYDAYLICCAQDNNAPLLTLDRAMATKARDLNVQVLGTPLP